MKKTFKYENANLEWLAQEERLALCCYDSLLESGYRYMEAAKEVSKVVKRSPQAVYVHVRQMKKYGT